MPDNNANDGSDPANFKDFCVGKTITNGLQVKGGSCNPIPMGDLPAQATMVSAMITFPGHNQDIAADTDFDIETTVNNIQLGTFVNPDTNYYTSPQQLNAQGQIIGHVHVTIQDLGGDINSQTPPDPSKFAFFKGINDAGDGNGNVKAAVAGGLPQGAYRVCTLTAAANHQPVTMPVRITHL